MAQPPTSLETKDLSSGQSRSHGRGGAGNINSSTGPQLNSADLQTPTIKSATYTTGRGGSGNMAKNDPERPTESRAAQDVDAPSHHAKEMHGTFHWGRGGEGNMATIGKSGAEQAREKSRERRLNGERAQGKAAAAVTAAAAGEQRRGSFQAAINKGKEMLGLRKQAAAAQEGKEESAVE